MSERSPARFASGRHAGVIVPLFSVPSRTSWGVGEIPDLPRLARWLAQAGFDFVQLLPVNEMQEGQSSPYSALTAMAIDPIFIALEALEDFAAAGGEKALTSTEREHLDAARAAEVVEYDRVRTAKGHALRVSFDSFVDRHWKPGGERAEAFRRFAERERWWLDDYALFRALHDEHQGRYWLDWPPSLRRREEQALAAARDRLGPTIQYYEYLQWVADEQWQQARRDCGTVGVFGDFPFMVSSHSADVWARQDEFRLDVSVGVPPDAFSETGQDWGLPLYRWDVMSANGYEWVSQRANRCAELFDAFRIDHLVGFYRTYFREADGDSHFVPADEPEQRAQGEALMRVFSGSGAQIIAEDLGQVPDFVRESLRHLRVPGLKVLRWEREWDQPGHPFRDPAAYPACSVAISGTHDTETLAEWWLSADEDERAAVAAIPSLQRTGIRDEPSYSAAVRDALLTALFEARSDFALVPLQDVFGWSNRINVPAIVDDSNWTWRLPWPVDDLLSDPVAIERAAFMRSLASRTGRV